MNKILTFSTATHRKNGNTFYYWHWRWSKKSDVNDVYEWLERYLKPYNIKVRYSDDPNSLVIINSNGSKHVLSADDVVILHISTEKAYVCTIEEFHEEFKMSFKDIVLVENELPMLKFQKAKHINTRSPIIYWHWSDNSLRASDVIEWLKNRLKSYKVRFTICVTDANAINVHNWYNNLNAILTPGDVLGVDVHAGICFVTSHEGLLKRYELVATATIEVKFEQAIHNVDKSIVWYWKCPRIGTSRKTWIKFRSKLHKALKKHLKTVVTRLQWARFVNADRRGFVIRHSRYDKGNIRNTAEVIVKPGRVLIVAPLSDVKISTMDENVFNTAYSFYTEEEMKPEPIKPKDLSTAPLCVMCRAEVEEPIKSVGKIELKLPKQPTLVQLIADAKRIQRNIERYEKSCSTLPGNLDIDWATIVIASALEYQHTQTIKNMVAC